MDQRVWLSKCARFRAAPSTELSRGSDEDLLWVWPWTQTPERTPISAILIGRRFGYSLVVM